MASKLRHRRIVKPLGKAWGRSIQEVVADAALRQARFELRSGKHAGKELVEVTIPVHVHLVFKRAGRSIAADGGVHCHCSFSQDSAGSVCICVGPGAAECDCPPQDVA
jgi:hypothetical protein